MIWLGLGGVLVLESDRHSASKKRTWIMSVSHPRVTF